MQRLKIIITSILLVVTLILTTKEFFFQSPTLPSLQPNPSLFTQNSYNLSPLRKLPAFEFVLYEPYVKTPPGSKNYWFFFWRELLDSRTHRFTDAFFAAKRIEELEKWGSSFGIMNSIKDYKELSRLCPEPESQWPARSCLAPQWEASLGRYVTYMHRFISTSELISDPDERVSKLSEAKEYLRQHELTVSTVVNSSNFSEANKQYLSGLSSGVFSYLKMLVDPYSSDYSVFSLRYRTNSLEGFKDKGIYSVQLDSTHLPEEYLQSMHLFYNNIDLGSSSSRTVSGYRMQNFSNVRIDQYDESFNLNFSVTEKNLLQGARWKYEKRNGERPHRYYIEIKNYTPHASYLLRIDHNVAIGLNVSIQEFSGNTIGNPGIPVSVYINPQVSNKSHDIFTRFFGAYPETTARLEIATTTQISDIDDKIVARLIEYYEPILHLTKTSPLPDQVPTISATPSNDQSFRVTVQNTNTLQDSALRDTLSDSWKITGDTTTDTDSYTFIISPKHPMYLLLLLFFETVLLIYLIKPEIIKSQRIRIPYLYTTVYSIINSKLTSTINFARLKTSPLGLLIHRVRFIAYILLFLSFSLGFLNGHLINDIFITFLLILLLYLHYSYSHAIRVTFILVMLMLSFSIASRLLENQEVFITSNIYAFILFLVLVVRSLLGVLRLSFFTNKPDIHHSTSE